MRIGLDIDGTITRAPEFFAFLSKVLMAAGHHVAVVTHRMDRRLTEEELAEYGVQYHELILPEEFDHEIAEWKIEAFEKMQPDIVFEDMLDVVNGLSKSIVSFVPLSHKQGELQYK
ncbi:MAG TPA: hypothetical protein PKN33_11690 [Phycisphaerae bacterium]|nr:hypothetical protein [Phycisphaerae bacterium]